jgi:hypothetical protein
MNSAEEIIQIALEYIKDPTLKSFNNEAIARRFGIKPEDVKKVKDYVRALELEKQEERGIPDRWYEAARSIGKTSATYAKNRKWSALQHNYGEYLPFDEDELRRWGKWVAARKDVGHLIGLEPLFIEDSSENLDEEKEKGHKKYISNKRIWYDEERDSYTTYLPGVPHAIELPGEAHRDLIRAYSNFDGQPASVNELARTFQLPRNWIVKYLRVHEITHDREPFTSEEIMSRSEDELAEEALQIRRAALYTRLERDKWSSIQKDAQKWREYEAYTLRRVENILGDAGAKDIPRLHIPPTKRKFIAVISPTDFHWGKKGDVYECGEAYDRPTAKKRLISSTEKVLEILVKQGVPEKIVIGIGSDFFNADNYNGTTTSGTPQDNDGNMVDILATGCELMTAYIDLLRQVAPVEMVLMAGNHDRVLSVSLHLYLQAWYRNCKDVTTVKSATSRQYITYKNNLLCFHHGDGVKKTSDLARLAAVEAPQEWGSCDHRMVFTGHLHYEKIEEDRGFVRYQLPSLSGEDKWHARSGYVGNRKIVAAVLIDEKDGILSSIYASGSI